MWKLLPRSTQCTPLHRFKFLSKNCENLLYNRFLQILNFDFCPVFTTFGDFWRLLATFGDFWRVFASFREFSRVFTSFSLHVILQKTFSTNFNEFFMTFSRLFTTSHDFSRVFPTFHEFSRLLPSFAHFSIQIFFPKLTPPSPARRNEIFIHINSRKLAKTREKLVKTRENSRKLTKKSPKLAKTR